MHCGKFSLRTRMRVHDYVYEITFTMNVFFHIYRGVLGLSCGGGSSCPVSKPQWTLLCQMCLSWKVKMLFCGGRWSSFVTDPLTLSNRDSRDNLPCLKLDPCCLSDSEPAERLTTVGCQIQCKRAVCKVQELGWDFFDRTFPEDMASSCLGTAGKVGSTSSWSRIVSRGRSIERATRLFPFWNLRVGLRFITKMLGSMDHPFGSRY